MPAGCPAGSPPARGCRAWTLPPLPGGLDHSFVVLSCDEATRVLASRSVVQQRGGAEHADSQEDSQDGQDDDAVAWRGGQTGQPGRRVRNWPPLPRGLALAWPRLRADFLDSSAGLGCSVAAGAPSVVLGRLRVGAAPCTHAVPRTSKRGGAGRETWHVGSTCGTLTRNASCTSALRSPAWLELLPSTSFLRAGLGRGSSVRVVGVADDSETTARPRGT